MTNEQLIALLAADEDGFVERKTSFDRREAREAIVAFANSAHPERPGVLFIGIRPDGSIKGIPDGDSLTLGSVDKICKEQCFPPIPYKTASLQTPDGNVLAIIVPLSPARPHFTGHAFVREGSKTTKASQRALEEMIAARNTKAGAILGLKGHLLSISVLGKQLGEMVFESHFNRDYEGSVVECDAHQVTLFIPASGITASEPIEWVIPSRDTRKHRPRLTIQRPY